MIKKIIFALFILFTITACGCISQTQPNQTKEMVSSINSPVSQNNISVNSTSFITTITETQISPKISDAASESKSGKSQYLTDMNGYLENISVNLNSIKSVNSRLVFRLNESDYAELKESSNQLKLTLGMGKHISYNGDEPYLINIDAMFPQYQKNLIEAANHYYQAGEKGLINDFTTAYAERKAGDTFYWDAIEPGQKIIIEMKNQNVSISKNIQDANGIHWSPVHPLDNDPNISVVVL